MNLLTLYAKKEPTTDSVSVAFGLKKKLDTVIYKDRACTETYARWPWHYSSCPRRGQKRVTLNCWRWNLEWVCGNCVGGAK